MENKASAPAIILLVGLEGSLAAELRNVLDGEHRTVLSEPALTVAECARLIETRPSDVVFCAADRRHYCPLLEAIRQDKPGLPVVVVSRHPEVSDWLDAFESGVADYCAAPFESTQLGWILQTCLRAKRAAAA